MKNKKMNKDKKLKHMYLIKLEEYSRKKSLNLFHLTSLSHIRRRLKRDVKSLSKEFQHIISEEKILQWIDETLERINSHFPYSNH